MEVVVAAPLTDNEVWPETFDIEAAIVALPGHTPVARPLALMVLVVVGVALHVASAVMFCVLPSLYVPAAANCCVAPMATVGAAGVTAIDVS
jgi:hypothetical protein